MSDIDALLWCFVLSLKLRTSIDFTLSIEKNDVKKNGDRGDKQESWWDPKNSVRQTSLLKLKPGHDIFTIVDV